jgi:hypothetical protein
MSSELFNQIKPDIVKTQELITNAQGLIEGLQDSPAAAQALRELDRVEDTLAVIFKTIRGGEFEAVVWLDGNGQEVGKDRLIAELSETLKKIRLTLSLRSRIREALEALEAE